MAAGDAIDRLNAAERELLLLLGCGHTAKSIAALKGLTEFAVNERFRSARRKTGLGSSREIARLLVAQQNRDDFMGLAAPTASTSHLSRPDAPDRASPFRRWSFKLTVAAVLVASAIFGQQTSTPVASSDQTSSGIHSVMTTDDHHSDLAALSAEVWTGGRDGAWSSGTEAALLSAYRALPLFAEGADSIRSICSEALCEVTGTSPLSLDGDVMAQARFHTQTGNALGLDLQVANATTTKDTPPKVVVVAYWRRRAN